MSKKPYRVTVSETLTKNIIVYADSEDEAYERAENLCNDDVVILDNNWDSFSRDFDVWIATDSHIRRAGKYNTFGAQATIVELDYKDNCIGFDEYIETALEERFGVKNE